MAYTGEEREIKQRVEAKDAEIFRESKQLATKTKAADARMEKKARRRLNRRGAGPTTIEK
jgi:hypothetical protein